MSGEERDAYAWVPTHDVVAAANSTRFAQAQGLASFDDLVAWSQDDVARFWDAMVRHLGLPFAVPYERVVDAADGWQRARWFTGGELNLAHACVHRWVEEGRGDDDAVRWEREDGTGGSLTYAGLAAAVDRAAGALAGLGVEQGDRVAVMMPMAPEAVIGFYAIASLGAVAVPIFSGFAVPAVRVRLQDGGVKAVLTASHIVRRGREIPLRDVVAEACADAPTVEAVVVLGGAGGDVPLAARELDWEAWIADGEPRPPLPVPSEHPLLIGFTSGTTGRPKGALHVHGGFLAKIAQEAHIQADLKRGDVLAWFSDLGWIMGPWAIVGGHANGVAVALYDGAPDTPGPDRLWAFAARRGVTFLGVSPTLIRALQPHGSEHARRHDLTRLRAFGSTGEPWNPEPYRWLSEEIGEGLRPIINISGGTEVGACFLACDVSIPIRPCSLGRPALGMAIDVYDADGRAVRGEVGELVCTKPWPAMTRGLWQADDRFHESYWARFPGVWTHGDWALRDDDGAWFLFGRSDDALNIAGKRIGSAEYESALVEHPAVVEACVVGIPHDLKGEAAWCFAVLTDGRTMDDELRAELHAVVEQQLGKAFRAERIEAVPVLPKTRSGKIVRRAVRATVLGDDPGDLSTLEDAGALEHVRDVGR